MGSTARKIFVEPKRVDISSDYTFTYNANADILEATITQPVKAEIQQAFVQLAPDGGYQTVTAGPYQLGNILTYKSGYTQVSGFQNASGEFVTQATAVIEGLNINQTLTADLVVAQITTVMAPGDSVQSVSFGGSRIENLQIAGHPVVVSVNPNALGSKPVSDGSYFDPANVPAGMAVSDNALSGTILSATSIPEICVAKFGNVSLGQITVTQKPSPGQSGYVYDYRVEMIKADLKGGGVEGCVVVTMADPNGGGKG
jgi:hypothetical protein